MANLAKLEEIRIVSLNVNGLGNPVKRSMAMNKLKKEKHQICFLQETHMSKIEHEKLKKFGFRKTYYNSYSNSRQRGLAILISNSTPFELIREIKDKEGTYIMVIGKIEQTTVTLVNVYAPPTADKSCFKALFNNMALEMEGICICGGDFNTILNYGMDTTSTKRSRSHISNFVNDSLEEMGLIDVWRDVHPLDKDYTHYSAIYSVYSRIDYFFMRQEDRVRIKTCSIGTADISDHSALYLTINIKGRKRNTIWRLNVGLLNNEAVNNQIQTEIIQYLQDNDNDETKPTMIWDALKAVVRGKLIAISSTIKKGKTAHYQLLIDKLKTLESAHKLNPTNENLLKLKETRSEIITHLQKEVEIKARYLKQTYYESGPKATKLLARRLRKQQAERTIYKIKDPITNKLEYDPKGIENIFKKYYMDLYSQKSNMDGGETKAFLGKLNLPSIGKNQNTEITSPITPEELKEAIGKLKTSKSPGSDGFPSEWYKKFNIVLSPVLLTTLNWIHKNNCTPPSWKEAIITVLPKEKKDKELCESYRPISILNIDYKIYTSILTRRLQKIIPDLIDEDQTGFVSGRQTQDNIRRTLLIINKINKHKLPTALFSLDAMKAFDLVSWKFLYLTLERFGFEEKSIKCIEAIYKDPTARIKINGSLSNKFDLERGTRQGCCLSPTLFALYIEPLAQMIRDDPHMAGVEINNKKHVISLFADDVLIYLRNPTNHFDRLLCNLKEFGDHSGYRLNITKTQVLLFHSIPSQQLKDHRLNWEATQIKYLGVNITKKPSDLYKENYDKVNDLIRTDLERWSTYPLDFTDRINVIKMNIQPRLLYLFQSLPIHIPKSQFVTWDRHISRFIWAGKRPRVRYTTLQLPKSSGGMALPCLKDYYNAAQIRPLLNWCSTEFTAHWKDIETNNGALPVQTYIGEKSIPSNVKEELDPITILTLENWHSVAKQLKFTDGLNLLRWFAYDGNFTPGLTDKTFRSWAARGATAICTTIHNGNMLSFQALKDHIGLTNTDFFRYLQLRDYYTKEIKKKEIHPLIKIFEISYQRPVTKAISKLYSNLLGSKHNSTMYIKSKWEKELGESITEETWLEMWENHQTTTQSHKWREFAWKNQIRFFITPKIKSKQTSQQQHCWRGCGEKAPHHTHVFWTCKIIESFWKQIHVNLCRILEYDVPFTCGVLYMGNMEDIVTPEDEYLCKVLLVAAKKAITQQWMTANVPSEQQWRTIVESIRSMEWMTYRLRLREEVYERRWEKWTLSLD